MPSWLKFRATGMCLSTTQQQTLMEMDTMDTDEPDTEPECSTGTSKCYMSQSVRDAGYEFGACDCEMTEAECKAEPKIDAFPIWTDGCEDICLCTTGPGCYQLAREPVETQH